MTPEEKAELENRLLHLEQSILRLEKAVQTYMLTQIEEALAEKATIITLLDTDLGLDQVEPRTPGLV